MLFKIFYNQNMAALSQLLLQYVSDINEISNSDAAKLIDKCLQEISININVDLSVIYNVIYSDQYLSMCLAGKCNNLSLEQCRESCHCVIYENNCVSNRLPNADLINKDPYKYSNSLKTPALENLVKLAAYLYYNYDGGGINDNSFDALEYELNKRLKLKGRRYEKIGADPVDKIRAELPIPVPSLAKIKPDTKKTESFLAGAPDDGIVWSVKLDGVSGIIVYNNGEIEDIFIRGNGLVGGKVTYLKEYITLPAQVSKNMIVRGEFIISKNRWEEKYKELYSNARSFVSAQINQGFISPNFIDIEFIAYDILEIFGEDTIPNDLNIFRTLKLEGFNVADYGHWETKPLTFDIISKYIEKRKESPYQIDGIVLSYNTTNIPIRYLELPISKVAFKMILTDQIRDTSVINVEWNISRYGRYKPVAVYEAVFIEGARLTRATAHNANKVRDWNLGVGTKIKIVRSGDVIPQIKDVIVNEDVNIILPSEEFEWYWKGPEIILNEIDNNRYVQIKRIYHFFSTLGVARLGEKTAEKLWENGFQSPVEIAKADIFDLIKIKGFGKKSSETLYNNIHNTMRNTPIDRYITASTTLDIGIGRKMIKDLLKQFPTLLDLDLTENEILSMLNSKKIAGIGPKRKENIAKGLPRFRKFVLDLSPADISESIERQRKLRILLKQQGCNPNIEGKIFVFTNFMGRTDYELEDYIYNNAGQISSSITSSVSAVISGGLGNITNKMLKANELNVPVYSLNEFLDIFNIKYNRFTTEE